MSGGGASQGIALVLRGLPQVLPPEELVKAAVLSALAALVCKSLLKTVLPTPPPFPFFVRQVHYDQLVPHNEFDMPAFGNGRKLRSYQEVS